MRIRLASIIVALFALCIPSVALADVSMPTEPAQLTYWSLIVAGYILAAAAIVARYLPIIKPLTAKLPPEWRWLPMGIGAASLPLQAMLPTATTTQDVIEAIILAAVALFAAFEAGGKSPDHDDDDSSGTTSLVVMLVAAPLLLLGCHNEPDPCTPRAALVVDSACAVAVSEEALTEDICETLIEAHADYCASEAK